MLCSDGYNITVIDLSKVPKCPQIIKYFSQDILYLLSGHFNDGQSESRRYPGELKVNYVNEIDSSGCLDLMFCRWLNLLQYALYVFIHCLNNQYLTNILPCISRRPR